MRGIAITGSRAALIVTTAAFALMVVCAQPSHARTDNRSKAVMIVHGFQPPDGNPFAPEGTDCKSEFDPFINFLRARGYRSFVTTKYYAGDSNCSMDTSRRGKNANLHKSSNKGGHFGGSSSHRENGGHNQNTLIEHLGYHMAWSINRVNMGPDLQRGTADDRTVDIVAHSMGGLIVRYALKQVERGNGKFPNSLLVEDVVTMGTPHSGAGPAAFCSFISAAFDINDFRQCSQMQPNSDFINGLQAGHGRHPDPNSADPTNWTVMGATEFPPNSVVSPESALSMNQADVGVYYEPSNGYQHDSYYKDHSLDRNAAVKFRTGPGVFESDFSIGTLNTNRSSRGARWVDLALVRADY